MGRVTNHCRKSDAVPSGFILAALRPDLFKEACLILKAYILFSKCLVVFRCQVETKRIRPSRANFLHCIDDK